MYVERVQRMEAEWRIRDVVDDVEVVGRGMADRTEMRERCTEREIIGAFGDTFGHPKVAKDDGTACSDVRDHREKASYQLNLLNMMPFRYGNHL